MTNLFKKSALVVALFAAASAQAGNLTKTGGALATGYSKQAENVVSVPGAALTLTADVAYPIGSVITVTFSGGQLSQPGTADSSVGAVDYDLIEATPTTLKFKTKGAVIPANDTFTLAGYQFTAASLADVSSVSATVSVVSVTGVSIDPAGTGQSLTTPVVLAGDQFAGKVTKATQNIDLASGRSVLAGDVKSFILEVFTSNANTFFTSKELSTVAGTLGTGNKVTHTFTGDWSFVVDTDTAKDGIQAATGALTPAGTGCAVKSLTKTALVLECDAATAAPFTTGDGSTATPYARAITNSNKVTVDLVKAGASATSPLVNTTFKVTSVQTYNTSKTATIIADKEVLELKDNGTTKHVDYMPFGENISQIVYVTNLVEEAGKVRLTVWDEKGNKVANNVEVATAVTKNGIIPLAGELKKLVGDKATGKYRFSVSLESSNATVYAAYRVGADAAYVVVR